MGGGGHGRVVLDVLRELITGVLDPNLKAGGELFGVPILGGDEILNNFIASNVLLVNGIGANPDTQNRKKIFESLKAKDFVFYTVQHFSAVMGLECELREGAQIMAGVVLQNRVQISENAVVNTRASIDHDCVIGAHAFISPGAVLCGEVNVEEAAFIGAGAIILPGIRVEKNAVIGAGSVVTRNVPAGSLMVGNPAVKIRMNA